MDTRRRTEVNVLGYRIEHVLTVHDQPVVTGFADTRTGGWHEVLSPFGDEVLGTFTSRADAERYIIERELESAQRAVRRNAA